MFGKKEGHGIKKWAPVFGFQIYEDYEVFYEYGCCIKQRGLYSNNAIVFIALVCSIVHSLYNYDQEDPRY